MPELPEVEAARRLVERVCVGLRIVGVTVVEVGGGPREGLFDELVFAVKELHTSERKVEESFRGQIVKRVCRKGKQLWFEFEDSNSVAMFHFGMTGSILIKDQDIPLYFRSNGSELESWPPRFTKLLLEFSDGTLLAFRDPRRLGRIKVCSKQYLEQNILNRLGSDPSEVDMTCAELLAKLSGLSVPIKAVLLDQERVFCGIGNYLADEVLYQSRIHPDSKASALQPHHIEALLASIKSVINTAVEANADYTKFPVDWLFHARWSKAKSKTQKILLTDGKQVVFDEVGGRTTAIVPSVQVKVLNSRGGSFQVTTHKRGKREKREDDVPEKNSASLEISKEKIVVVVASNKTSKRKRKEEEEKRLLKQKPLKEVAVGAVRRSTRARITVDL